MKKTHIVIHNSATKDTDSVSWGVIRKYHTQSRKWRDIGYHYGIELVGDSYEILMGRFETDSGAHCPQEKMNTTGIGICCIGNFDISQPSEAQWNLCLKLVRELMKRNNIPKENILGHREVKGTSTSCPGKNWDMNKFREDL